MGYILSAFILGGFYHIIQHYVAVCDFHTNWIPKLLIGIKNTNSWAVCVL